MSRIPSWVKSAATIARGLLAVVKVVVVPAAKPPAAAGPAARRKSAATRPATVRAEDRGRAFGPAGKVFMWGSLLVCSRSCGTALGRRARDSTEEPKPGESVGPERFACGSSLKLLSGCDLPW